MSEVFSEAARVLFEARGINPDVAAEVDVTEEEGWLVYPTGKRRSLTTADHRNPGGGPMIPWLPTGTPEPGDTVLVCEGETDTLAALSALASWPSDSVIARPRVIGLPGASFPADRLAKGVAGCEVYLAFDPDDAGVKATERAVEAIGEGWRLSLTEDLADTLHGSSSVLFSLMADAEKVVAAQPEPDIPDVDVKVVTGGRFVFDEEDDYEVVWGQGSRIAWVKGEPLLICGGDGTGKTTIAQQVALARLRGGVVLGYPVNVTDRRVLYIAADRPKQARRSLRRMVTDEDKDLLHERLIVVPEAVPMPEVGQLALDLGADTVFVDTLGAVAPGDVTSDSVGLEIYHALQSACRSGVEVCLLHHSRKQGQEWRGLEEVYGSRWITAPCGSVILLRGKAGSSEVHLRHVKQPSEALGPGRVCHDHYAGVSELDMSH